MKRINLLITIVISYFCIAAGGTDRHHAGAKSEEINRLEEQARLLALIEKETDAFYKKDINQLDDCWAHGTYVRNMGWWKRGGIDVIEGWTNVRGLFVKLFSENTGKNPEKRIRKNFNFRITENMAWCTFDEYGKDHNEPGMDMPGLTRATRIFEKQNGKWKIVYVGWLLNG